MHVAILGANSAALRPVLLEWAQCLATEGTPGGISHLSLFSRDPKRLAQRFTNKTHLTFASSLRPDSLDASVRVDAIINAVGVGSPADVESVGSDILGLSARFDQRCIEYIQNSPGSRYIYLSSGAVFGRDFSRPVVQTDAVTMTDATSRQNSPYANAKLLAELGHRAYTKLPILDLRIFSTFNEHVGLGSGFFLSDLANALIKQVPFPTPDIDFERDFVHPQDLSQALKCLLAVHGANDAYDLYSAQKISKFEILKHFEGHFHLQIDWQQRHQPETHLKSRYFSTSQALHSIGYAPKFTSLECIVDAISVLLNTHKSAP